MAQDFDSLDLGSNPSEILLFAPHEFQSVLVLLTQISPLHLHFCISSEMRYLALDVFENLFFAE